MQKLIATASLTMAALLTTPGVAYGQGEVNGAGATLFVDFFFEPQIYNDFIDVDGDGVFGGIDFDMDGTVDSADNLVNPLTLDSFGPGVNQTWFRFQYRSVGSVRGYREFVAYNLCADLPEDVPSERGVINQLEFADLGLKVPTGFGECFDDTDGDGIPNDSGTPRCPTSIDFANTDVESAWATQGLVGTPTWNRAPGTPGYGQNAKTSNGTAAQAGYSNLLASLSNDCDGNGSIDPNESLNINTGSPDARTIFDTRLAYSPVVPIANRGTGVSVVRYSELQHLLVTGRFPNGVNYAGTVRDAGSGTRNAFTNSVGVDASWGVGDHVGPRVNTEAEVNLGPRHQVSNCGGSGISENAVRQRRLAIGYTGMVGGSRAIADALSGRYEILSVIKDTEGATGLVRPTLESVINNADPNTGFTIGGLQTFATVGNPDASRHPNDPLFEAGPQMANLNAAAWINNLTSSIQQFTDFDPNTIEEQALMPGEALALEFFLEAAVAAVPLSTDPDNYVPNPNLNPDLRDFVLGESGVPATPDWGVVTPAGHTPVRQILPFEPNDPNTYSDGTNGSFYIDAGGNNVLPGDDLAERNALAGDFNNDGVRDINDTAAMLAAIASPRTFEAGVNHGGDPGEQAGDFVIPEVIGDFNGDGNLDAEDARYFADGLATVGGALDRKAGFIAVDIAAGGNYFGTTLATPKAYAAGDARGDVFGPTPEGAGTPSTPGASPSGWDGAVDAQDIEYICANFVSDWTDLDAAVGKDLSCDMDGDLDVDSDDVVELVAVILGTRQGDLDLDGDVDLTDLAVTLSSFGLSGVGYAGGDVNCDGIVDLTDLAIVLGNFGFVMTP